MFRPVNTIVLIMLQVNGLMYTALRHPFARDIELLNCCQVVSLLHRATWLYDRLNI